MSNSVDASNPFIIAIIATIATYFIGMITKIVTNYFDKDKDRLETHLALRKELREELDIVKQDVTKLQQELDTWKSKYFDQVALTNQLRVAIINLEQELYSYRHDRELE